MIIGIAEGKDRDLLLKKVREILPKEPADKRKAVLEFISEMPYMGISVSPDNTKLGAIMNFSLPAGQWYRDATCPGATKLCEKICYALKGYIQFQEYIYFANWAYVLLWPERFLKAFVNARLSPVFRVHVGGDFFEPWYAKLWVDIAKKRNDIRFFAYTRSWQDGSGKISGKFLPALREFSKLPNARLVLSVDRETKVPDKDLIPGSIRAWLAVDDKDMPPEPLELIFRHKRPSTLSTYPKDASSQEDGATICPYERLKRERGEGAKKLREGAVTCQNCAWCWGAGHAAYGRRDDDLPRFNMWAGTDIESRVSGMFRPFVPWRTPAKSPGMGGTLGVVEDCVCGAEVPCAACERCVGCLCSCPG
jgi:hypothetical protein